MADANVGDATAAAAAHAVAAVEPRYEGISVTSVA